VLHLVICLPAKVNSYSNQFIPRPIANSRGFPTSLGLRSIARSYGQKRLLQPLFRFHFAHFNIQLLDLT
jgi:hypothetical protein